MPACDDEMTDIDGFLALAPQAIELAVRDGMGAVAGLLAETTHGLLSPMCRMAGRFKAGS